MQIESYAYESDGVNQYVNKSANESSLKQNEKEMQNKQVITNSLEHPAQINYRNGHSFKQQDDIMMIVDENNRESESSKSLYAKHENKTDNNLFKQPLYLKKKPQNQQLTLQKQYSSTMQIQAPQIQDRQDQFEREQMKVMNERKELAEQEWSQTIPFNRAADIKIDLINRDRDGNPIVDLTSSQNILDSILSNLQGLTAEQQEMKKRIEERSRMMKERAQIQEQVIPTPHNQIPIPQQPPSNFQIHQNMSNFINMNQQFTQYQNESYQQFDQERNTSQDYHNQLKQVQINLLDPLDPNIIPLFKLSPKEDKQFNKNEMKDKKNYKQLLQDHFKKQKRSIDFSKDKSSQKQKQSEIIGSIKSEKNSYPDSHQQNFENKQGSINTVILQSISEAQSLFDQQKLNNDYPNNLESFNKNRVQSNQLGLKQSEKQIPNFMRPTKVSESKQRKQLSESINVIGKNLIQISYSGNKDSEGTPYQNLNYSDNLNVNQIQFQQTIDNQNQTQREFYSNNIEMFKSNSNIQDKKLQQQLNQAVTQKKNQGLPRFIEKRLSSRRERIESKIEQTLKIESRTSSRQNQFQQMNKEGKPRSLYNEIIKKQFVKSRSQNRLAQSHIQTNFSRHKIHDQIGRKSMDNKSKMSQATIKIQHHQLQKQIEMAIRQANQSEEDQINFNELKNSLFNLGYLPTLKQSENKKIDWINNSKNTVFIAEIQMQQELLLNIWIYLNPRNMASIEKSGTFDLLLLLMFNIGQKQEREVAHLLADHLAEYYKEFQINLQFPENNFQDTQQNNLVLLNYFFTQQKNAWTVQTMVQEFKQNHIQRYGSRFADKSSSFQSLNLIEHILSEDPNFKRNKSLQKLIPQDQRKYKEDIINDIAEKHTFTPAMGPNSAKLAEKFRTKILNEHKSKSREKANQNSQITNKDYSENTDQEINLNKLNIQNSNLKIQNLINSQNLREEINDFQNKIRNSSLNNNYMEPDMDETRAKSTDKKFYEKLQMMQLLQEKRDEKLYSERELKKQMETQGCTFVPKTNPSEYVRSKYLNNLNKSQNFQSGGEGLLIQQYQNNLNMSKQTQLKSFREVNFFPNRDKSLGALKVDQKDLEECTFKPKINKQKQKKQEGTYNISELSPNQKDQTQNSSKELPKGYYKVIERMRRHQELQEKLRMEEEQKATGNRYDRNKLEAMRPPSFLNKPQKKDKTKLLLSIEVSISPFKSGRIGVKEGDDLRKLSQNFCKAYQLGKDMENALVKQLEEHLQNYYKLKEIKTLQEQDDKIQKKQEKKQKMLERDRQRFIQNELKQMPIAMETNPSIFDKQINEYKPNTVVNKGSDSQSSSFQHNINISKILGSDMYANQIKEEEHEEGTGSNYVSRRQILEQQTTILQQLQQANQVYDYQHRSSDKKERKKSDDEISLSEREDEYDTSEFKSAIQTKTVPESQGLANSSSKYNSLSIKKI